jgi:pantoate--beta-alanine ligase
VRRRADLRPLTERDRELVIVAAARLGRTRLIDNVEVTLR